MTPDQRKLFSGLMQKKSAKDLKPLITASLAKTPDSSYRMLPLHWALSYGASAEVVDLLLSAFPDGASEKIPVKGWTALHFCEKMNAAVAKALLKSNPGAAKEKDASGKLPLHWAAEHNVDIDVARLILEANKDAAQTDDKFGRKPFKLACDNGASPELRNLLREATPKEAEPRARAYMRAYPIKAGGGAKAKLSSIANAAQAAAAAPVGVVSPASTPTLPIALMFPGQGSQYVNMLSKCCDLPAVKDMLDQAKDILGYDILPICLKGPAEQLQDTLYCQPAMYIGGLAAVEVLRRDRPEAVENLTAVAGLSLGEYTALTVAGVFSFADGLTLVQARAQAMQYATEMKPQGMLSCAGLDQDKIEDICKKSVAGKPEAVCQISNFLFEKGYTIGGTSEAIQEAKKLCEEAGAMQARLVALGGGFHTPLMIPAKEKLEEALRQIQPKMSRPRCKVYMNVNAKPVGPETDPAEIVKMLGDQLTSSVLWINCVRNMIGDGVTEFYECGPMKQLKAMMKRIDNTAFKNTNNIEV